MTVPSNPVAIPDEILAKDRLKVFVSSTILECKEERSVAGRAIFSLNHEPVLFERLGAQPYPPRRLYVARLRSADIVIAIYKDQYGWIDAKGGMTISGLEDEYRLARDLGLPMLIYISREEINRAPQLRELIAEIMEGGQTVAFFETANDLFDTIRDDLTRLLTHFFYRTVFQQDALALSTAEIAERLVPTSHLIRRSSLERELKSAIALSKPVLVYGAAGVGKSVFLAGYAKSSDALFVSATNLTSKDLFGVLVNKLLARDEANALQFATLSGAIEAFRSAWKATSARTVVVDDPQDREPLTQAIAEIGGLRGGQALVMSARERPTADEDIAPFEVPPLSSEEAMLLISTIAPKAAKSVVEEIINESGGIPLLITQRSRLVNEKGSWVGTQELWLGLSGRVRELVSYIALSPNVLSAQDLILLRQEKDYSIADLGQDMAEANEFVHDDNRGYAIRHDRIRDTILHEIQAAPQQHVYLAERLSRRLARIGDYVSAYTVASNAGSPRAARLSRAALNSASRQGDFKKLRKIAREALAKASELDDRREMALLSLGIAQAAQASGDLVEAEHYIRQAEQLVAVLKDNELSFTIQEYILTDRAQRLLDDSALQELELLKAKCRSESRLWEQAKIALSLSMIHMSLHRYERSAAEAEEAISLFQDAEDTYGRDLARRNLAGALSAIPGRESEANELLTELNREIDPAADRRYRAWLCNLLVRRFRAEGKLIEAEERAGEAITIGHELGDQYVVTLNSIGLGNVYRDMRRAQDAISAYAEAQKSAQQCGRRDLEAHASRLTANVYNRLASKADAGQHRDFAQKAAAFARHAAGLYAGQAARGERARALDELGDALQGLAAPLEATDAYFEAASLTVGEEDDDLFERTLLLGSLITLKAERIDKYLDGVAKALGISRPSTEPKTVLEAFYEAVEPIVAHVPENAAIPLLGIHFGRMFRDVPPAVSRFIFNKIGQSILANRADAANEPWRLVFVSIVLCAAVRPNYLRRLDLSRLSATIAREAKGISYKPISDGGHWVITLDLGHEFLCSITTFDDQPSTIMVAMFIAFFLKGFEKKIRDDVLGSVKPLRRELAIFVSSFSEVPEDLRTFVADHLVDQPCVVSRPSDAKDDTAPTWVTCRDDIGSSWNVGEGRGNALQIVLGLVVLEVVFALTHGQLDPETLRPKVVSLVRHTIS
jgi:tetratricopeptide (TPR) repeat protein